MDQTAREITKIGRIVNQFVLKSMMAEGIGSAEFDYIHLIRHHPGITQAEIREELQIDKGAAARRAARLEEKGYLVRKPNPNDGRSQLLYATKKAEQLKISKSAIESAFYDWLLEDLSDIDRNSFCRTLDLLYQRAKVQRRSGFTELSARLDQKSGDS